MESLTVEQRSIVEQLEKRIGDELTPKLKEDPTLFFRFLTARDFDLDKAEAMLRKHMAWRKRNDIDTLLRDFEKPKVVENYIPLGFIGCDKDGCSISICRFSDIDNRGVLKSVKKEDCLLSLVYYLETDVERMIEQSKKYGKLVSTNVWIFDYENFSFLQATHKPTLDMLLLLYYMYEENYPERLKVVFVVNASMYFSMMYAVLKPVMSANTVAKFRIFGKDGWKEELLKIIPPDVLPAYLGGKRTDPDGNPKCFSVICPGGPIPKEFYLRSPERRLSLQPGVQKYLVSRMSKVHIRLVVDEPGSTIEWEFESENKDIAFGLYYKEVDDLKVKPKELIPKQRVEAHLFCETGMYLCGKAGTYILIFDNTYSWLQQKEIFCRTTVVRPRGKTDMSLNQNADASQEMLVL